MFATFKTMRASIDYSLSKRRTLIALFQGAASAMDACDAEFGEFRVYVVEICTSCHWNHLVSSFLLGDGKYRKPPRKVRTLADDD